MASWGMAKAKAQLSEVVHQAEKRGPQKLLRSGREVAVVMSIDEWEKWQAERCRTQAPELSLADFIMSSPLHGMKIPRLKWRMMDEDQ